MPDSSDTCLWRRALCRRYASIPSPIQPAGRSAAPVPVDRIPGHPGPARTCCQVLRRRGVSRPPYLQPP